MPKIELTFTGDTPEEVNDAAKAYVATLKGTRGGKSKEDGEAVQPATAQAPPPMAPPSVNAAAGFPGAGGFAPPAAGVAPQAGGPFAPAVSVSPEVSALVARINARIDSAIASGQPADAALNWFRSEGTKAGIPEAANATMDQIKGVILPKMTVPALTQIAQMMNA